MNWFLALPGRAHPVALLGVLIVSTASVVALEAGPLNQLLSSLRRLGAQVPVKPIKHTAVGPDAVKPFYLRAANRAEQDRAEHCMTDALYYEAANEPEQGQRAVAQVIVNRVRDPHFPKSICGVVYEGWQRSTGCQFSFACDGSIHRRPADPTLWSHLRPIAKQALNGHVAGEVGASTHYYARYVKPNWVHTVTRVTEIGRHVFCSWKGKAGLPRALAETYKGGEVQIGQGALDGAKQRPPPRL